MGFSPYCNRRVPYLSTYDQIMENGTRVYTENICHKCGWKVDQEDNIETSNQYGYAQANVRYYHKFCYNGMTTHDREWSEMGKAMEESMND